MVALPKWLKWAKKDTSSLSLRDLIGNASNGKAGVPVTQQTALQAVTALACARVISEGLAQVPLKLYKDRADGGADAQKDDPLYKLVNATPNDYSTSFEWRETMGLHLVFAGNSYCAIVRAGGVPVELMSLNPKDVKPKEKDGVRYYEVQVAGKGIVRIEYEDMLHIRGISWDGMAGLDGIWMARDAIGLAVATEEHGSRLFANGAEANGTLTTPQNLTDPEIRKAMRESWNESHQGASNTGKIALLWGGLQYQTTAMQNDQAQFLETRMFQVQEVCRWARVLPIMVGHADKSMTFASASEMFLAHVVHTLGPWYVRVEQALDKALLTEKQRAEGYYFRFNTAALMRGTPDQRSSYFSKALGSGGSPAWMTQDEVRALDEMNPLGGKASILAGSEEPPPDTSKAEISALKMELKSVQVELSRPHEPQPINVDARTTVNNPAAAPINIDATSTIHTPEVKQADVYVDVGGPTVTIGQPEIKVMPAEVNVNVPKAAPPVINVEPAKVEVIIPARKTTTEIERDGKGNISRAVQLEIDA